MLRAGPGRTSTSCTSGHWHPRKMRSPGFHSGATPRLVHWGIRARNFHFGCCGIYADALPQTITTTAATTTKLSGYQPLAGPDAGHRRALDQPLATPRLRAELLECRLVIRRNNRRAPHLVRAETSPMPGAAIVGLRSWAGARIGGVASALTSCSAPAGSYADRRGPPRYRHLCARNTRRQSPAGLPLQICRAGGTILAFEFRSSARSGTGLASRPEPPPTRPMPAHRTLRW